LLTTIPGVIHAQRIWPVYLVVALGATARSFMRPAVFALSAASAVAWWRLERRRAGVLAAVGGSGA